MRWCYGRNLDGNERLQSSNLNYVVLQNPNVTREVIRYENFVVIIPVLIKYLILEKNINLILNLFHATFQFGRYNILKKKFRFFFAPQNTKNCSKKLLIIPLDQEFLVQQVFGSVELRQFYSLKLSQL